MQDASSLRQNIEADLDLLFCVDMLKLKVLFFGDQITNAPIEPGEGHLDVEAGALGLPSLIVVNLVDLLKQVKVFTALIEGMNGRCFVLLVHPDQALENISWLQLDPVGEEVGRVETDHILMLVVHLDVTDKFEESIFLVQVFWICGRKFE